MMVVKSTFADILERLGIEVRGENRSCCPIHGGDNPTAFSFNEDKGLWYCHRCARGGDKITLVMLALSLDFKEALAFLGIPPDLGGLHPVVSPRHTREARLRRGLIAECRRIGRRLRDEFYYRNRIIAYAQEKMAINPDDELGWRLLEVGYEGVALDEIERLLDMIDIGSDEQKLRAWRALRGTEKFYEG